LKFRSAALLAFAILFATSALAHELGATRVEARFHRNGTYTVTFRVDPESLVSRLEFAAGLELSDRLTPQQRIVRLRQLAPELLKDVAIEFDGHAVKPSLRVDPATGKNGAAEAVVTLFGDVPRGARTFRWRYDLLFSKYVLTTAREGDANVTTEWLTPSDWSSPVSVEHPSQIRKRIALQYLALGFTHIIPRGLDHILFVLGIFLLTTRLKPVLAQVTAFTVAHTLTLGLSMYGIVALEPRIVEPLIALSIVYVAIENLVTKSVHAWRIALVFAFGLLHGMGFAGVLRELGIPRAHFVTALLSFNVGVELGQLTVIGLAFVLVASWARHRDWYRARVVIPASLVIAATGALWVVQRIS
jgi:hypothetical protein